MRLLLKLLLALAVIALASWCILVSSYSPGLQPFTRYLLGALAFLAIPALFIRSKILKVVSAAGIVVIVYHWGSLAPSLASPWELSVSEVPWAEENGDVVKIHNVRDFYYRSETSFDVRYVTKTVRLSELSEVNLFTSYWAGDKIAHIIMSFGFSDGQYVAFSIETRKAKGQGYSTIEGFFRNYALIYVAATERDLIGLRTAIRQPNERVYLYRLRFNRERNTRFFRQYLRELNELREKPRFYNTITTNCTTQVLWNSQAANPGVARYNWKLLLSGYTADYLYESGVLDSSKSFPELRAVGLVNERANADIHADNFSQRIREGVPTPNKERFARVMP